MAVVVNLKRNQAKQPMRPHFIREWAALAKIFKPAHLAREAGFDKSQVSKWFKGATPSEDNQKKLADFLGIIPSDLFSHPDDVWFSQFMRGKKPEDVQRAKNILEQAFPRKQ